MMSDATVNIPIHRSFASALLDIIIMNRIMHILNFGKSHHLLFKKTGPFFSSTLMPVPGRYNA